MTKQFTVLEEDTLLPFLLSHVKNLSRNSIKSLLSKKQVSVNGKVITKFDHALMPGQRVEIAPVGTTSVKPPFPILFEDDSLLVIDKPAGLLSIATEGEKVKTAYHQLTAYVKSKDPKARIFVVHRLDRDTSGLLLFAKREEVKRSLQEQWDDIVERRGYVAVVEGKPPQQVGTIQSYLHENKEHIVYSGGMQGGKKAVTNYEILNTNPTYSLLQIYLDTGRKNQIRVHMKDLSCPVAGDKKYGARTNPLGRLALHASELRIRRPDTGETLSFKVPAPRTFQRLFL